MMQMISWAVLRTTFEQWLRHRSLRLGAALAYYSVFSIGPLLLIVTAVAGLFFGQQAVRRSLSAQFEGHLGNAGGSAVEAMLAGASLKQGGGIAAIVGVAFLVIAAVGILAQLKDALNTIWNVEDPKETSVWWYVRTYALSLAGVMVLGLLLTVSLVLSAALAAVSDWAGVQQSFVWQGIASLFSLGILSIVFGMLFKWFPDTDVEWRDVLAGGIVTALLFEIGKLAIGWYVGLQGLESTYGAAASILVLLIWVYYSAQIVLFGAELTHAFASERGSRKNGNVNESSPNSQDAAPHPRSWPNGRPN
jgi:membrane protein